MIILLAVVGGLINGGAYYNRFSGWLENKTGGSVNLPETGEIPFRLGLDLLGGTHLVYRADMSQVPEQDQASALEGVRDVIERRVNVFGVSEPLVQTSLSGGEARVIVELAGVKDVNEAINMIGETPLLEFKEQIDEVRELTDEEQQQMEEFNADSEAKAREVLEKLEQGENFAQLAREHSFDEETKEAGGDLGWLTEDTGLRYIEAVRDLEIGEYAGDMEPGPLGYEFFQLTDKREKQNPFTEEAETEIKASHILICHNEIEDCGSGLSKDEAYEKIKALKERATPDNFARLARENSTGPSAPEGGDLGWFSRGMMVEPFEQAAYDTAVGGISYVVESQFGYHIIYKEDERPITEYRVSRILLPILSESDIIGDEKDWQNTELTGKNLDRAQVTFNQNDGSPQVALEFDSEGADMFEAITERNVGSPVAIYLDSYPISVPTVNEKISGGQAVISGNFNIKEAKLLAQRLNAGALPVPIDLINQQTVGATLGQKSLSASLMAGLIGLILVALFMILYYRLPGILAVFSLLIYGILVLAIFKIWPVTLTLAGMAGFILSIGMAVDANVLIFERLKEELAAGKPLDLAIQDSFDRAWPSIRDGNISTLITCFILIQFTTSIVKGFAITLGLGVIISMFSAIIITKTFLQLSLRDFIKNNKWLLGAKSS